MTEPVLGQVLTAMVTPFDSCGRVDDEAVIRLVDHLYENGSDGICRLRHHGREPDADARREAPPLRLVKEATGCRGRVIAGTAGNDTPRASR